MKTNEINMLTKFLDDYDSVLSHRSTNDWTMDNTLENLELLKAAHSWNVNNNQLNYKEEYETWIKPYEQKDLFKNPVLLQIRTSDFLIFGYLRSLLKKDFSNLGNPKDLVKSL